MADESSVDGKRLVELFQQACSLTGSEQESFVRKVRDENSELGNSLAELLGQQGPVPTEVGSFAKKLKEQYGSEADPYISLEGESERSDYTSEIVQRLAGREGAYGRYKLKGEVARGGQGAILRVWDEDLCRNLAMKVVLGKGDRATGDTPKVDSKTLGRFLEEAQVTGQLDHPGIVPVHELGLDSDGRVYFTMKLVKGRDLKAIFDLVHEGKEGWTQTRALNVMLKVCEAMAYAHNKGVIHRDLKPGNVMVGKYGEVYVMDWGLARVLGKDDKKDLRIRPLATTSEVHSDRKDAASDDSPLITMDGDVVGTPAYMSPEQARGDLEAMGPQSDVYALGAMLYHLLAEHMPYVPPGRSANNYSIWRWVQDGPPNRLNDAAANAPVELVAICERAMAREAGDRYADTEALAVDLRAFLEGRVVDAYETGAWAEAKKWVRRNKPLAASLAAGVVALAGGLGVSLWSRAIAAERLESVLRLSAKVELDALVAEAATLWGEDLVEYDDWLERAEELRVSLYPSEGDPGHLARLEELRARALPWSAEDRERDRITHARLADLEALDERLSILQAVQEVRTGEAELPAIELEERWSSAEAHELNEWAWDIVDPDADELPDLEDRARALALARRAVELAPERNAYMDTLAWASFCAGLDDEALETSRLALELAPEDERGVFETNLARLEVSVEDAPGLPARLTSEHGALAREVAARRTWRFEDPQDTWWHDQLEAVVEGIRALHDPATGLVEGSLVGVGPGVAHRRTWLAAWRGAEIQQAWTDAISAIGKSSEDSGQLITPQTWLAPLGTDPQSGLWEFADMRSGRVPDRDVEGRLETSENTGVVFVLLPGGTFLMGAQKDDPELSNYDPEARYNEGPVQEVTLSAFFVSKYELTQGQWRRLGGDPIEFWSSLGVFDSRLRLSGPTQPVNNVTWTRSDAFCRRWGWLLPTEAQWEYAARGGTRTPWWTGSEEDEIERLENVHSRDLKPVGARSANPFGLHDVCGNVMEWCLDGYDPGIDRSSRGPDPFNPARSSDPYSRFRVLRGGSFMTAAVEGRSAQRNANLPEAATFFNGLRPARALPAP